MNQSLDGWMDGWMSEWMGEPNWGWTNGTVTLWRAPPRCHRPHCRSERLPSDREPENHLPREKQQLSGPVVTVTVFKSTGQSCDWTVTIMSAHRSSHWSSVPHRRCCAAPPPGRSELYSLRLPSDQPTGPWSSHLTPAGRQIKMMSAFIKPQLYLSTQHFSYKHAA